MMDAAVNTIEDRGFRAGSLLGDAEKAKEEGAKHRKQDDDRSRTKDHAAESH